MVIHNNKAKLIEWQLRSIEADVYKYKMVVKYTGELKKPGNGLMATVAFKLSLYKGIVSIITDERNIVFLYRDENAIKQIRTIFGYKSKWWQCEEQKTNIEEQKKLIENNNNQIYFDKNINDHLKMFGS